MPRGRVGFFYSQGFHSWTLHDRASHSLEVKQVAIGDFDLFSPSRAAVAVVFTHERQVFGVNGTAPSAATGILLCINKIFGIEGDPEIRFYRDGRQSVGIRDIGFFEFKPNDKMSLAQTYIEFLQENGLV